VTSLDLEVNEGREPAPTMANAANSAAKQMGRVFGRQILQTESLQQLLNT
jgi:hypothetical protein